MMDALHDEILDYLNKNGLECIPIGNDDRDIFVDVVINDNELRLKCKFPSSFPYKFPQIFILNEFYKKLAPLPHINEDGLICTFDDNKAFPNFYEPTKVVYESILKAIEIIKEGITGVNKTDFIDEFTSYWNLEASLNVNVYAIFNTDNKARLLYCYYKKSHDFYITDDIAQLKDYLLSYKNIKIKDRDIDRCLYIPLDNPWYPPYPKTNKEIYLKVKEEPEAFCQYYNYLKNSNVNTNIIIFSHEINGNRFLAAWTHKTMGNKVKSSKKGKTLNSLSFLMQNVNKQITKLNVIQLDRRRLFLRGGDGKYYNKKISITGCGSIGSYLIQTLAELGISDFELVDNEPLCAENIARHMCGASEIGRLKTEAIKEQLINHYPYIKCKSYPNDVYEILSENINIYNNCDINFIVVGNIPIETKFIELFNQGSIIKPLVIIWVEPYLLGGHAVIIQRKQDILTKIYDSEFNFKYSVLIDGKDYSKRETGCQSTYIPYSAIEAKQFIYNFMDYFINEHILKNTDENYLYSWSGNLRWARKQNLKISDLWLSKENRTINIQRLD